MYLPRRTSASSAASPSVLICVPPMLITELAERARAARRPSVHPPRGAAGDLRGVRSPDQPRRARAAFARRRRGAIASRWRSATRSSTWWRRSACSRRARSCIRSTRRWATHELRYILGHAEPRVIVADAASVERMRSPGLATAADATLAAFGASRRRRARRSARAQLRQRARRGGRTLRTARPCSTPPARPASPRACCSATTAPARRRSTSSSCSASARDDTILAVTPLFHGNAWGAACTALEAARDVRLPEGVPRLASSGRSCTTRARPCSTRSAPSWRSCWRRSSRSSSATTRCA